MRLKTGLCNAMALALAGLSPTSARADGAMSAPDVALRKVIEGNYARYVAGIKRNDNGPEQSMETSDYCQVQPDGTVSWRWRCNYNERAMMKFVVGMPVETVRIDQFKVSHHRIDVQETETWICLLRDPRTKKVRSYGGSSINWDTWVLTRAGWKLQREVVQRRSDAWDVPVPQPPAPPAGKPGHPAAPSGPIDDIA